MTEILFFDPKKEYGIFSNYHVHKKPIVIDTICYESVEHYFQSMKFNYSTDDSEYSKRLSEYTKLIRTAKTPNIAKCLACQKIFQTYDWAIPVRETIDKNKDLKIINNWDTIRDDIMLKGLRHKFNQDQHAQNILLSTENKIIKEINPRDNYWAIGSGKGLNKLGTLLCQVRDEIRIKKGHIG